MGTDTSPEPMPGEHDVDSTLQRECDVLRRHNARLEIRAARSTRMKLELLELAAAKVTMSQELQQLEVQAQRDAQRIKALQFEVDRMRASVTTQQSAASDEEYDTLIAENRSLKRSMETLTHQIAQQAMIEIRLAEAEERNGQLIPLRAELEAMQRQVQEVSEENRQLSLRLGDVDGFDDDSVVDFRRVA